MRRGAKPAKAKGESKRPLAPKPGKGEGWRVGREAPGGGVEARGRGPGAADSDERDPPCHVELADRRPAGSTTIVESAVRLCDASWGAVFRYDGALRACRRAPQFLRGSSRRPWPCNTQWRRPPAHISGRATSTGGPPRRFPTSCWIRSTGQARSPRGPATGSPLAVPHSSRRRPDWA